MEQKEPLEGTREFPLADGTTLTINAPVVDENLLNSILMRDGKLVDYKPELEQDIVVGFSSGVSPGIPLAVERTSDTSALERDCIHVPDSNQLTINVTAPRRLEGTIRNIDGSALSADTPASEVVRNVYGRVKVFDGNWQPVSKSSGIFRSLRPTTVKSDLFGPDGSRLPPKPGPLKGEVDVDCTDHNGLYVIVFQGGFDTVEPKRVSKPQILTRADIFDRLVQQSTSHQKPRSTPDASALSSSNQKPFEPNVVSVFHVNLLRT